MKRKRIEPPCKDCPDRVVGCHDTCKKYLAYKKRRNYIKQKQRAVKLGQSWE